MSEKKLPNALLQWVADVRNASSEKYVFEDHNFSLLLENLKKSNSSSILNSYNFESFHFLQFI